MKILIVYYSLYGHVLKLAKAVKEGAESVKGAEVLLRRVEEFDIVLKKTADDEYLSQVREQQKDIPVCTLDDLRAADGVLIGSPTRYGNMTAQMKQLIDSTASLWLKGEMEGKPAGVFTCTASTHGGQETTLATMMIPLLHLGMLIVGVPYSIISCFSQRSYASAARFKSMTGKSLPPTMGSVGAMTRGSAGPARSGRPPRETTAPTTCGRSAAATSAAPAPVLAPK
jgi:NAD(P)H dehydrogenase (quinone)